MPLCFDLPLLRSVSSCRVLLMLALGSSSPRRVEQNEKLRPCDSSCFAGGVGMGPLPLSKESMDLFIHVLAVRELVLAFHWWGQHHFLVQCGRRVLLSDGAVALDRFVGVVTQHRLLDPRCILPFVFFS